MKMKAINTTGLASLCFSDRFLNPFGINHRKSDDWMQYDVLH